jgi:hypothetical protein
MKHLWSNAVGGLFLAPLLLSTAWGSGPPQPGTVNYIEGQVAIGSQALNENSVGSTKLTAGQTLSTASGRAEILLTPGIFLRIDNNSSLQMASPGLADTIMTLNKGRALVEVTEIRPQNNVRINESSANTQLLKPGLYDFDANRGLIRVFDGKAVVQITGRQIELNGGHQLNLTASGKLKSQKFERASSTDDFYRWASLRSSYLAEANVDAARRYAGASGYAPSVWSGDGWYWNPWFSAYTFIPGDGIFFDPFGWGFYSPWLAFGAPYFGYGFGGYGYGYGGYPYHHFGPGYHPAYNPGGRSTAFVGHAHSVGVGSMGGVGRDSGFSARGFSGGGFHGGGFGGGGFHGGGGGGRGR